MHTATTPAAESRESLRREAEAVRAKANAGSADRDVLELTHFLLSAEQIVDIERTNPSAAIRGLAPAR